MSGWARGLIWPLVEAIGLAGVPCGVCWERAAASIRAGLRGGTHGRTMSRMNSMGVTQWLEQLHADREALEAMMLRLGHACNGPARRVSRITQTKIAHTAIEDAIAAMDRLIARVPAGNV